MQRLITVSGGGSWSMPAAAAVRPKSLTLSSIRGLSCNDLNGSVPKLSARTFKKIFVSCQMGSDEAYLPTKSQTDTNRNLVNFSPCIWGDYFASISMDDSLSDAYANEIEGLKAHVRGMMMDDTMDFTEKISLINTLHRLGVSYLFEQEIYGQLEKYLPSLNNNEEFNLYTISTQFQVFRQFGYKMSCDVFNKFLDEKGRFKESKGYDVMGILSLYEASQLRVRGEDVLEEANIFARTHLEIVATQKSHPLGKRIKRALEQSCYKGIPRMEARVYISFYEEDKSHNELILRLAKLDFNLLQLLYQKELNILTRWYKERKFTSKSSFARDRVVEGYLFAIAVSFEPRYSLARIFLSKVIIVGTRVDDAYDSYGELEELQLFTDAINSWDICVIDQLPDYLKFVYRELLNLYNELYDQGDKLERSYSVDCSKEAMKSLSRAYLKVAKWFEEKYMPPLDEYTKTAYHSSAFYLCIVTTLIGIFDCANEGTYEWIKGQPKILEAAESICRLQNDIADREFDQRGALTPSAIECYRKELGVSEKEAIEAIEVMISNSWKDLYEEFYIKSSVVPLRILRMFVDFAGSVDVIYKHESGVNKPERLKDVNTSLFINPVSI